MMSCQFTNLPNRQKSRGVFQNRGVCGQAFPLLPSSSHLFFCSGSNFPAMTRLKMLATQASIKEDETFRIRKSLTKLFDSNRLRAGSPVRVWGTPLAAEPPSRKKNGPSERKPARELLIFEYPAFADERSDLIG